MLNDERLMQSVADPAISLSDLAGPLHAALGEWDDAWAVALLRSVAAPTALATRLNRIAPELLIAILREGAGLSPVAEAPGIRRWIEDHPGAWSAIVRPRAGDWRRTVLDLSGRHSDIAAASAQQDRQMAERLYQSAMDEVGADMAIGRWLEHRTIYSTDAYRSAIVPGARRDVHLGLDLFAPALTPLYMPSTGTVIATGIIDERLDYGGFLVTRHEAGEGALFALWGHLSHASARRWTIGERVLQGEELAQLGDFEENGWWLPHLHLQLSSVEFADFRTMPGVGEGACRKLWAALFPDPTALVLGLRP